MKKETIKYQSPITYYGGKRRMAKYITSIMPRHRIYVEPFFGGGAVFFEKQPSYLEAINDKNDMLINFYEICQADYDELSVLINKTLCSETQFRWAQSVYKKETPANAIEKALAVWLVFNQAINSNPLNKWSFNNGTGGSHSGILMAHKRASFCPWLKQRLQYVQISCRDALEVIQERDSTETFFYLDPPYINSNQGHYSGYTGENLEELLEILKTIHGQFILSNYPSNILTHFATQNEWHIESHFMSQDIQHANKPQSTKTEVLLMNFEPKIKSTLTLFD